MSQENLENVRRAYDAVHRQDVDTFLALHYPDCEILPRIVGVEGGNPYRGHDGLRAYWSDMHASFTDWLLEPEDMRDFGDTMIVKVRFRGRGRDSGVKIDQLVWQAIKFRDGRATWWAVFPSEAEALEAVGLNE